VSRSPDPLPTSAFDYELPARLIARYPAARRDESRLLVLDRASDHLAHRRFHELVALLPAGDALVLNDTRVLPARLLGRRSTGGNAEVLLLHPARAPTEDPHDWLALVRPGSKLGPGRTVVVGEQLHIEILGVEQDGARLVRLHTPLPLHDALLRYGRIPLPPYIDREADAVDAERYQTVYARNEGSVAAPTAGLHFTESLLGQIANAGVRIVRVQLHVGAGTFRPVETEDPGQHVMHEEAYVVDEAAARSLNEVRATGARIWAVGTTVARTLETVCDADGRFRPEAGWTRLFIRPPYAFRGLDHLITNFHLPRSTLLMLVAALAGYERLMHAYRVAIAHEYRFYSYGDAMVVV
jgi:S-adenosylmethionine:tRNA ribosyltransferase-isomerase